MHAKKKKREGRRKENEMYLELMGWVTDASSLCLDYKGKREQKIGLKREVNTHVRSSCRKVKSI